MVFVIIANETRVFCPPLSVLIFRPAISTSQPANTTTFGDAKASQLAADLLLVVFGVQIAHQLEGRLGEVQLVHVMLRENAAAELVVANDLSFERDQIA